MYKAMFWYVTVPVVISLAVIIMTSPISFTLTACKKN